MSVTTVLSPANFQIQFDSTDFASNLSSVTAIANVMALGTPSGTSSPVENDYATLAGWFGVVAGAGFGPSNRTVVTLTPGVSGGLNFGYSTNNSQIHLNPNGRTLDQVLSLFVNEMIEVLMSYTGPWKANDSGGEGLSRVAGNILHPASAQNNVFAWLASNPALDITAAQADVEFRQDWITQNFTGGSLKGGGHVAGDDDGYSIGCAILFINYLKDQLGYSMAQIIQNADKTLLGTYENLTGDKGGGLKQFRQVIDRNFPPPTVGSPNDDPFPLFLLHQNTLIASADAPNGDLSLLSGSSLKRCDLMFIKRRNSASNAIEVHMLGGSADFSQFVTHDITVLAQNEDSNGDFLLADSDQLRPDLYFVKRRKTGSPTNMELHVLSGSSNYTQFLLHTTIPLAHSDDPNGDFALADFDRDGVPDLVFIKRRSTGSGSIEIHVLGSQSGYQNFVLHTGTALTAAEDQNGDFLISDVNGDGEPELVFIKRKNTPQPFVEAHILTRASQYSNFAVHTVTLISTTDAPDGAFSLGDYNADGWKELIFIRSRGTAGTNVELHIAPLSHWKK